ncbi:Anaphase spindle elongation protein [Wickerhamomyces ciferrii]|uniref:Anaphase spindle elongation protein n=1 Tax=Wickerhamomyces ciferrii (strain ATCC 14091 / BCRC 22168 / CBS 111 / JCM 3599 / NBRC 0793 / NRRL Y-1031 F-60-10) TaxID=1206466 RepID=K0KS26_WICCF|nr:Anaphase spindle elongation protein [Wickerhamomyces ciferrii]CCH44767.1 Anaphase spindle elongation protein [Wickerhamomyces ciferrii]
MEEFGARDINKPNDDGISSGRLNLLSSPLKISLASTQSQQQQQQLQLQHINKSLRSSTSAIATPQEENGDFAVISNQFTSLIEQLSKIYTEIGYSKNDIQKNEKKLFTAVSNTFDQFLEDSLNYKNDLIKQNNEITTNLKIILNILDDPTGNKSIPDLYLRNLVVKENQETSTLLSKKKSLNIAVNHVMGKYQSTMLKYLENCMKLNKIQSRLGDDVVSNDDGKALNIPNLENSISIFNVFESSTSSSEIYEMVASDPETFFQNLSLCDLSIIKFDLITSKTQFCENQIHERLILVQSLSSEIIELSKELEIDYNNDYITLAETIQTFTTPNTDLNQFNIGQDIINELERVIQELKSIKESRFEQKQTYQKQCEELWVKLGEEQSQIENFQYINKSLSIISIQNYESELERLLELKKVLMKDLILDARNKITEFWDLLFYSDEERDKFSPFKREIYDDQTLSEHEEQIESLSKKYETYKPILDGVQQFKDLIQDKQQLEISSKDSSRLLQRNSHKILMEEEKIRKRLSRQLPKIVESLKIKLNEFEKNYGYQFTFVDSEILSQIEEQGKNLANSGRASTRRVVSAGAGAGTGSTAPTRPTSRAVSRQPTRPPSRAPSTQPTRQPTRAPTRQPSRMASRTTSRLNSPTKPIPANPAPLSNNSSSRLPIQSVQGIRKPSVPIPSYKRPTLASRPSIPKSQSCIPKLSSPPKDSRLNISSNMLKDPSIRRTPIRATPSLQRSTSSFQPQLSRLDEQSLTGSPKSRTKPRLSPLKESNRSNLPLSNLKLKPSVNTVTTSPLKSLKKDEYSSQEKIHEEDELISSDVENDTYSSWRREQLQRLNKTSIDLRQDTF